MTGRAPHRQGRQFCRRRRYGARRPRAGSRSFSLCGVLVSYWLKLYQDTHADARLRKARARAIWPWVLCRLKDGDGFATDDELDPWRAADDHDSVFSEADAAAMIERLKSAGMLVSTDCGWAYPEWERHVGDPTNAERQRRFKERKRAQEQSKEQVTPGNSYRPLVTLGNGGNGRAEQSRAEKRDGDDVEVVRVRETPELVTALAAPSPPTAAAPEPTVDDVQRKLKGHPAHDALLPIARAAVSILDVCPEVYTLEAWLQSGYSLPRIEYGLQQAKQSAAGQWMPMGKIIISAGRWMQRAAPEEYQKRPQQAAGGAFQVQSISTPQEPERRPLTAAETAEMLKELGV